MQSEYSPSRPKLSIITVVRNGEKTIERSIQSVISQLTSEIEYIIIDGNSTDSTIEIIKKHQDYITFWQSEPDKNIADAFNKGISNATGEYVIFLNADDWFTNNSLGYFLSLKSNADIIHGNIVYYDGIKEKFGRIGNDKELINEMTINHPATFMKLALINELGGFNTSLKIAIDYDLILKAKLVGATFFHIDKTITNMSLSGVSDLNWFQSCKEVYEVKQAILGSNLKNKLWFAKQTSILFLIKNLERFGLSSIVDSWRSKSLKWNNEAG